VPGAAAVGETEAWAGVGVVAPLGALPPQASIAIEAAISATNRRICGETLTACR
jgi:hypothetical protein